MQVLNTIPTEWTFKGGAMSWLFAIFFKSYDVSSHHLNSKDNGTVFLFKIIFKWSVDTDGKDAHGLKREKVGSTRIADPSNTVNTHI